MMINKWECDHVYEHDSEDGAIKGGTRCTVTASGVGGSIGLRAIGWYFEPGPVIRCPAHRPDRIPCHDAYASEFRGKPCSACRAEAEATRYQDALQDLDALAARTSERLLDDEQRRELAAYRAGQAETAALVEALRDERDDALRKQRDAADSSRDAEQSLEKAKAAIEDALSTVAWAVTETVGAEPVAEVA